jgi:hypothetical protein
MTKIKRIAGVSQSALERARKRMSEWEGIEARVKSGMATPEEKRRFDAAAKRARELDPRVLVD